MNEDLQTKVDGLRAGLARHLAMAHEGTALHTILAALDMILDPASARPALDPAPAEDTVKVD